MRHTTKAGKFFTEAERTKIREATKNAEARTIGEVAVIVVDSSDRYHETEMLGGLFLGGLLALLLSVRFFGSSVWPYITLSFLFFFPCKYLFQKVPLLKMAFIGPRRRELAVRRRALRAFYEKGLYKTKKNTGVLFFLSLMERKVWVLADKGINEKIEQDALNKFAEIVSAGIRNGKACESLCEGITRAGELLAKHFPITADDTNELSDEVMTEE